MFQISVVSLLPEIVEPVIQHGVIGRACAKGLIDVVQVSPRDFVSDIHRTVDDRPYGGGPGMVLKYDPLRDAIHQSRRELPAGSREFVLSAQGRVFAQALAMEIAAGSGLLLVAGRYEGVDERFIENFVDREISIGDYVLSGGELPIMVLIEAMVRQIPGVLGDADSAKYDSFADGLLEYPQYTRPATFNGWSVPDVLLSGHHAEISKWREEQRYKRTLDRRPDLLDD